MERDAKAAKRAQTKNIERIHRPVFREFEMNEFYIERFYSHTSNNLN